MKKTAVLLLIICLLGSLFSSTASAQYEGAMQEGVPCVNLEEEIARAYHGISDIPVTPEIRDVFHASAVTENGAELPVEVVYTIRDLGTVSGEKLYAVTAAAGTKKTETGSKDTNDPDFADVRVAATLYWTDNLGTDNSFDRISGNWTCYGGAWLSDREVYCQSTNAAFFILSKKTFNPTSNSFDYNVNITGCNLDARISARCHPASDTTGADWVLLKMTVGSKITT